MFSVAVAAATIAAASSAPSAYREAHHIAGMGPRPAAGAGEARAQRYMAGRFRAAGLRVATERFRVPRRGTSRNVIGVLDTRHRCLVVLLAHADSSPRGPGAIDNASGMGVLAALAPRLEGLRPGCDVWLASTGAEERFYTGSPDHLGSLTLVRRMSPATRRRIRFGLDSDEVGVGQGLWMRSPVPAPRRRPERLVLAAARRSHVAVRWVRDAGSGNSDHRELNRAGIPAAVLEEAGGGYSCRELACDTPSKLRRGAMARAERLVAAVVGRPV